MYDSAYSSLHPHENSQELRYYMFAVNLDRCGGSYNTLDNLYSMVCVPNETEELNLHFLKSDNRNKWIQNINKTYLMQMWM